MRTLDPSFVREFLQSTFNAHANDVRFIGAGMFSQAFAFTVDAQQYIVRVSECLDDFQKDAFAHAHFSASIPIPRVIRIDRFEDTEYFCITERCPGKTLNDKKNADDLRIVPHLFATLDTIHRIDVSHSRGWGFADAKGNGHFDSWTESLLALYNQKFEYEWATLARLRFWDQQLFENFYGEMKRLLSFCSTERFLIHRDFGFDNVVANDACITGVLDWAEFGYGDFLYDVAYLDYYSQQIPYGDLWYARATTQGRVVPNFEERMRCYMLNIGLHGIAIAATLNQERAYIREHERMRSVLLPSRRASTDWTQ